MDEFLNRIDAQRKVLAIINSKRGIEPLFGLSRAAIERWAAANGVSNDNLVCEKLFELAKKLSFLANRSQQQVSSEYQKCETEISAETNQLAVIWQITTSRPESP